MSTTVPGPATAEAFELVGRTYTKARRRTKVVGRWPGGGFLPFGPYTGTQLGVMAGSFALLAVVMFAWQPFGWLPDLFVLIAVPIGLGLAVRTVHVQGRNPLLAAASAVLLLTAPSEGRLGGRPLKRPRPKRLVGVVTIGCPSLPARPAPSSVSAEVLPQDAEPGAASSSKTAGPVSPAAAASRVQALLAQRRTQLTSSHLDEGE
jgi:hypothetical protein